MLTLFQNLDLTCNRVKSYWQKAAQGSMSIWFAAWLTTAAYENAKFCFNGGPFSCSLNATDHEEFIKKYDAFLRAGLATADETPNAGSDGRVSFFLSGLRLFTPWLAVLRWKRSGYTSAELEENVHEKLEHLITVLMGSRSDPGHIVNTVVEFAVMRLLLKSVFRMFLRSRRSSVQFNSMSCPLVFDLHEFLYAEGNSVKTNIVFGLKLLVESYKSFILDEGGLKLPNCRIQILKFGRDVRGSLRRVRDMRPLRERGSDPCSCLDCTGDSLIHSLDDFDKNLECIVNDKRFDLYSQAPWVAGTQIVHIATEATKLGMRLGNRGQYVGSVLQLYNFLLQLRVVDEETVLLEKLCNILESTVFHGSRPKSNFFSQYALFSGGRLEFDRSKKRTHEPKDGYQSSHPNTRWRIGMTKSSTKALNYHSTSILAALWSCSFRFSCYSWAYVWYGTDKSKNASQKELESATTAVAVHPFVCALDHLESRVGPECIGDFPQAKINWLEVYITCTEILANISRAAENDLDHPCPGAPDNDERWTEDGEWFVQQFLQMSEKYSGDISKSDFASKHNRLVESATKGIRRAMKGE